MYFHGLAEVMKTVVGPGAQSPTAVAPPAKKARVGGENGTQGPADEATQEIRARVEKRYNERYVVETLAKYCERGEEDELKSWEEYYEYIAEEGEDDDWEKCLEHMNEMVKLIRDQRELISMLSAKLA